MTRYFVYFISGSFARKYMDKVTSVCDTKWFLPVMALCVAIQLPRFAGIYITPQLITYIMTVYTLPIAGLLFVFGLFVRFRSLFTETSRVTRCLSYVGRRTLDIYLMHYFLIYYVPFFHDKFVAWGVASQNRLPMFLMAIVILLLCLLVSAIIRKNRFLGKLLFAAKYEKTDNKIQIVH
ncbi:MAG: acyltransferase family protein, partial [Bacteroidales bacterium]|nr:acyltransferase family protein [Candidatus Sodaliphilus fimicaballi]